jgi:NAD-dependent DNA ligase
MGKSTITHVVDDWDGDRFDEKMTLCKNCTFVCDCGFLTRFTRSGTCVPCSVPPKCEACWQDPGSLGCTCAVPPEFDSKGDPLPRSSSAKRVRKDSLREAKVKKPKAADPTPAPASGGGALSGKAICFTGALTMVRREAEALAAAHGAIIRKGVSGIGTQLC